jgi:NAD(P)-dependent dehydrogenase (short-subunit alcohol dehydrogenase family)
VTILITGGARGIGAASARLPAEGGAITGQVPRLTGGRDG